MDFLVTYQQRKPLYQKLGKLLVETLEMKLTESKIGYLSVNHRVKEEESFREKIERKAYKSPFQEMEDLCGIRVICFYSSDIDNVKEVIKKNVKVIDEFQKQDKYPLDVFGYRSSHLIGIVPQSVSSYNEWKNLVGLKVEIQVRTVLMHAWAEIEHKLSYKSTDAIEPQIKRKFSQLSALLEIGDEQFEIIRNHKKNYQNKLIDDLRNEKELKINLNIDTLDALLIYLFPIHKNSENDLHHFYSELLDLGLTASDIKSGADILLQNGLLDKVINSSIGIELSKVGVARLVLDITSDIFWTYREPNILFDYWETFVLKKRSELKKARYNKT